MTDGLKDVHREAIIATLAANDRVERAVLFGSRATGTNAVSSDVDIALFGNRLTLTDQARLAAALDEIPMAQSVDLLLYDSIRDRTLRDHVRDQGVEWYSRSYRQGGPGAPGEWPVMSLREAGVFLIDCEHRTPPASEGGYPYVGIPQVKDGRIDLAGARRIAQGHFREWTRKAKPQPFDVVLSRRCNPGDTGFVSTRSFEFALGQNLVLLRADGESILKPFLRWLARSPEWWNQINKYLNVGAVFDSLKCGDIPDFLLPIPPLDDQRAIAHVLGTLDDKIELNRRMNATLEAMARALFRSWFVDFDPVRAKMAGLDTGLPKAIADLFPDRLVDSELGEMPAGWRAGTLAEVARLNPESWGSHNRPDRILYVDLATTKWGYINEIQMYSWANAPSRGRRVLRRGDTIVGTVRPGNGSFALIDRDDLTGSTGFAVLRPTDPIEREIVWCAATSADAIERLAHLADGGAYPAVSPKAVLDIAVALPEERVRLAFSSVAAPLLNRVKANQREARLLGTLRDALLPQLVSGELRVTGLEAPSMHDGRWAPVVDTRSLTERQK